MKERENYIEHLRTLSKEALEREIDGKIADSHHQLDDNDEVLSEIAMTNASGFLVDNYEVTDIDLTGEEARVSVTFRVSGDQDEHKPWSGTKINGQAVAVIDVQGRVSYTDVSAKRDLGGDKGDNAK